MTCNGYLSGIGACHGEAIGYFRLATGTSYQRIVPLCAACLAVAGRHAMDPVRVPEWIGRANDRRLPGRVEGGIAA